MSEPVKKIILLNEPATIAIGKQLARVIRAPFVIFLQGELGAGKTTLVRSFLKELGYSGNVKSPTYTLVESYLFPQFLIYHFDLYRLSDPEELEFIGIREYFGKDAIVFIEWPERGTGLLAPPDLKLQLDILPEGRLLTLQFLSKPALNFKNEF